MTVIDSVVVGIPVSDEIPSKFVQWWIDSISCKQKECTHWFWDRNLPNFSCSGGGCSMKEGAYTWYKDSSKEKGEWYKFDVKITDS